MVPDRPPLVPGAFFIPIRSNTIENWIQKREQETFGICRSVYFIILISFAPLFYCLSLSWSSPQFFITNFPYFFPNPISYKTPKQKEPPLATCH